MIYVYLTLMIISAAFMLVDMVLRYMEKLKNFGIERKLFTFTGQTIPAENFLPLTLSMVPVFFLGAGAAGYALSFIEFEWYFVLPLSLLTGSLTCFVIQYFIRNALNRKAGKTLPVKMQAAGIEGFTVERIEPDGDGYGLVEFEYNDVRFRVPAVSANETPIPKQERVIVLYEEDGMYFVESIREVYDVIDEKPPT